MVEKEKRNEENGKENEKREKRMQKQFFLTTLILTKSAKHGVKGKQVFNSRCKELPTSKQLEKTDNSKSLEKKCY